MNNIFRAYVTVYDLPVEYKQTQDKLLKVLIDVESRRNRALLLTEHSVLDEAYELYVTVLESSKVEEVIEMLEFVHHQRNSGRWIVSKRKTMKNMV